MNTPIFTCAKPLIERTAIAILALVCFSDTFAHAEWTVDFSRRARKSRETELSAAAPVVESERLPAAVNVGEEKEEPKKGLFDTLFDTGEPVQDLVILHTEKGFVPSTVRVRKNGRYRIHIVNVNDKEKNVSFILDGFSEHHATFYGKIKTFQLEPKKEGAFSFQSPETSSEGKLVVFNPQISVREPAAESKK